MMWNFIIILVLMIGAAGFLLVQDAPPAPAPDGTGTPSETSTLLIYAYDAAKDTVDGNVMCSAAGLAPLERHVPKESAGLADALTLLFEGRLTDDEIAQGRTTEFPLAGFSLVSATTEGATATLSFNDPLNSASGGSCRISIIRAQLEATALQFPGIRSVVFLPEEILQP